MRMKLKLAALLVAAASALRPQRLQTPQREPSATQWANAAPQTLEVVAKQCLKTACACMAAANIIADGVHDARAEGWAINERSRARVGG